MGISNDECQFNPKLQIIDNCFVLKQNLFMLTHAMLFKKNDDRRECDFIYNVKDFE